MITLHWNTGYRNGIPETEVEERFRTLLRRDGAGNDFLGWMDPESIAPEELLAEIVSEAERLRRLAKVVVVAGIGGSYLGARAVIEALSPAYPAEDQVRIVYAGNSLSEDDMHDLLELLVVFIEQSNGFPIYHIRLIARRLFGFRKSERCDISPVHIIERASCG